LFSGETGNDSPSSWGRGPGEGGHYTTFFPVPCPPFLIRVIREIRGSKLIVSSARLKLRCADGMMAQWNTTKTKLMKWFWRFDPPAP
jgi:hypothetical protein